MGYNNDAIIDKTFLAINGTLKLMTIYRDDHFGILDDFI